jgi:hypothetical protein
VTIRETSESLLAFAPPGLNRWLEPLAKRDMGAQGTAMAIRERLRPGTPLEGRREAMGAVKSLVRDGSEMGQLLGWMKQDLGVTTS